MLMLTTLLDDTLAFGNVLAHRGGDTHGDDTEVSDGMHVVVVWGISK